MAERPLYTLYKNLKAQNYDVPDDYNKFESALTRDGKSGADNRHAIYENLKAQNFDVPDTYERFYSALFEPRSKTSSRAKGGSVPMSAADRARYLSVTQSVLNTARQVKRASGNVRKTVERAKKFNANDGNVTIGFKNPLQNKNVQKNKFNYNSTTGKTGTYTTTDGVEFDNEYDASQHQNKLDKYGEEWNKAVDMGIVPSELDKADPDLSDTDVAMRQMERRQEWLNENQNRRSKELNESMHLQDSPFVASGGAVAPSSFNTAISNEANRLSDVEYGAYNTAKAYNQMLRTTLLQELKEQKQRNENAGWWKDKWNDVSNYFGGMLDTMFDPKLFSQGVMDAAMANNMLQVKKGMEDGTIKKGSNAGNAAQAMLGAIQQQQGESAKQQQNGAKAYQYGDMSGRSLKFMGDFLTSGWRNVMTTGFTKAGEKVGEKMALGTLGKWFTKNTGRVLGDMAGSAALAATNQLGSTYNNVIDRYVGMNNENGGVTQDKDGDLKFNEGVSLGKAIKDGFGSATIENFSEMFGEYLPGASKILSKLGLSKVSSFFEKIGNNAYYKWLSNATNKSGIQGVMAEISEEEFGTALHAAWGDGEGSWSDFNVFTNPDAREKQIDTCLGMFYSVGFMQAPRTAVGAINAVQYFKIKHQVNKADKFGQGLFNDNWDEIKSKIDVSTNADLTKTVLDATRSESMTAKQKGAVINYAMFLSKLRGFNQASDAKTKDKVEEGDTAPTLSNDLDDAYTEGHNADDADKHDIQIQQEDQMKTLAAALGISEQQLSGMSDEELESLTGQDDKLDQAIYDYQLSSARYQGVVDDAQDKVDLAAHQAEQRVDMYTDKSRGSVRNATIKASGGAEDYGVYIISGNIATHDDGSIDISNSDDMILYFDPTTNSVEHADALMFAELGEELPADEVKAKAVADAKENAIKEIAGIIDGTVDVGSQFSVTDADGTEHTYEVLADNGDGTAMVTIDGNVPTELVNGENVQIPYSFADLQQMKDLEDQKRLEAAKAEREQMENERAAQQTQETEQTQLSFDFNQILNDNGNVVLVDVLDKNGNTKYPDSKLFLIRDAGAKAKVVELKSDGTIVPHAVNKEDVATISSMSLDEYKQAFAESSMIEDNSGENRGEIEAEPATIEDEITPEVAENTETTAPSDETAETPSTEQTPAITLEDGTIVPMLDDGNPDFSKLTAAQTAELYDTEFGEDAESVISSWVSDAKKALDKANNMTVKGKTFVEQKASKDAKEKAIADAQAAYDSAIAIRDAYNERQLAKVEDTAEGRKNLIEKARRKFARLKSAVKDDAEAVAQIYKETVGTLLHRLYDGTGIDVTDTIPLTAEEYVASNLGAHSLNYEGTETSKSVKQETGLSREDFAKTQLLAADGKGTTIDALVHSLWENRPSNLDSLDTQDIRNALIGVLTSGFKASETRSFIENIRIAQAEKLIEEERTAAENAAYYEQQKAKEEEEKKKAEPEKKAEEEKKKAELDGEEINPLAERITETDEEVESDGKYGTIYNKVYLIDGDKRVTKVDEPDSNGNYTGSYYMYDGKRFGDLFEVADYIDGKAEENESINTLTSEQQKAKEDGEKLGFPAVDKEGEPINEYVVELAEWAKEQGLNIDPTSKWNNYADLFIMCKDGFGVGTLVPDRGESINKVVYFPDNVQDFDQLWKLHEEFNVGRDIKHSADMDNEQTQGAMFYDGDTAREFKEFVDKKVEEQNKVFGEQIPETDLPFSAKENGKQQTTAERADDVEKNKVDDMKVVDNIVGQKTRKAFDRLAKMMGAEIQWQYSDKLGNGWIQENTDADGNVHRTIFITLDSSITEGAQFIFGHEMTHQIKNLNPAAYNELTQLVLDTYGSDAFDKAVDETMKRYSDAGLSGRNKDYYAEEVVADSVGEMIRDLNLAHTLAMKMSHPLLAAIHEILQKIKLAFFGTEYEDVTKNIIRSIEQAYVKTANGEVTNSETGEDVSYSLRQKPEPKKKGVGYKVFVLKDGKLYPPMVANPDGAATPVGVWLDADAAPIAGESKTGRPQVKQGGKGTQGGSGKLAYRPGWHLGVVPYAIQFNRKDAEGNKTLFPKNFVFAEVEYAADVDYQEEARQEGINPSGKYQHSLAGLKHLPTDGYYMYRTNPNPETDPWVITGAMKVNRILTRAEQAELVKNAGREPQQIQEGDIVTDDVVNSINQEIADAPKFSLKVYHGSGADFTEFDFDHMGEGAGSQAFGWGGYVTSSEEIGKSYANLSRDYGSRNMYKGDVPLTKLEKAALSSFIENNKNHEGTIKEGVAGLIERQKKLIAKRPNNPLSNSIKKRIEVLEGAMPKLNSISWDDFVPSGKNLYEVDIPEDNGSNYLEWENPLNEQQINDIRDALAKNGVDVSSWEKRGFKLDLPFKNIYAAVLPMMMRCEPKKVSKFLSSLGFTGIKYPAGTIMGGAEEGDTNYVIFKPEDMKITEHTKFSLKSKPVRFEAGKKLSDEEKKEVLSTLKDAYKVNGVPYHIEETAGGKEKRVYEPTADSYVVSDITNRPLRYYITLPDGRVAHPTEVYPNISDNEVKSSATKQGLLDNEADQIVSTAIGNMKDIADNAKAVEVLTELQNLPHETHDVGYGINNSQSYNYKTGIFTSDAAQAIDYVVRRMRRKEDVPAEVPAALKKAVADSYGMVDNLIDGMSSTKFSLKDEKIKSVAEKFGVNEDDVAMYANAVERGSTADAARARANIKRYLLQANEDKISSLKDIIKYTKPINEALKENFGDLDAMIEERRKQVEAQRNAMEAARKRAQEEEEKRQKHLSELSLIPTDELDKRYMDAIANNDESTAREMLDESARRNGYGDVGSDYQGQGAWAAPSNPQYESDEARRADIENSPDVNLEDIALGYNLQPDDYFDNPRAYMNNTAYGLESAHVIKNALDAIKNGEKDVKVKVYRAVPTSVKEGKLRNGDWVTPSKKYAEMHGDNRLEGKYRIIEDEVPANQLWWDGNDVNEFGFDDGKEYRYKNAKNNRKLNDLITYDNKGNAIPPSKRFNSRKSDIRFSLKEEKEKIVADAKANGTYMTAPNGEKTKLDAEQWATVRTANFKNWFGDWENDPDNASKVVDENGEPMVVWHGRSAEFNTFEKKEGVRFIMGLEDKVKAEGFFFSPDKGLAEEFAFNSYRHRGGKANVIPCFLNIRRPMDLTGEDYDRIYEDVTGWEYMVGMDTQDNLWGIMDEEGMADKIKEKGYDGAFFVEEVDDRNEPTKISYCALDANQIKSADNNNGDFSADNDDIRFSLRYDKFEHDLNQWKKDNNLPKDAQRPTIPQRNVGESAVDFLRRVDEYRKLMALWKTAPTYEQHLLSDDTALGEFNRELQKGSVLKRIAFQDSMLAIRKAQEAIMKEVGVDSLNMAEDAYTAENRSHGKGKNEFEEYNNEFLQPLRKAYHQMKKVLGDSYDNVRIYMMAKHGLERDAQMAFKMSLDADYEDVAQRSAAYRAYKGDMNRITNDSDLEFGRVDFNTWRQRDNALRAKYSPSYMNYRYDKDGTAYDYSGLSALFGGTDFEEAAHKLVRDIESSHVVEVQDLWNATNAATKKILRDGYKAGMMSKDTYQHVRDMYSHYIPLRGWDGTTADQVWDYVGGGKGSFNQTLKTAHGRTSIADDPIAYIENMAESGILLNNKNWVKQHLMLLAQNHPTSLLTLSKAWYVKSTDANGNEEWIPSTPQITSQMNSNQVKAAIDAFEQKMEQMEQTGDATQKRDGLNIAYPQTHSEEREHEVRVMKDGEEYVIYVNGDPQLAQAMNNTRAHRVREIQSGKLDRAAAWLGRKMAAAYTSLSPLFIPSNYFRDLTMTLASTAIREDAKYNYLLRKNLATSWNLGFMLKDYQNGKLREKVNNGNATQKEQMFYDFMMNGGETGFVSSLDVEDLKKKFKNDLKDLDRWKANPVKVGHTIMDSIEFLNRAIEDSNRFAVYMTSIQYGRSIDEAVNDAKNVTLNFNRKGTGEYGWQMIRNLYLFINPAVQSLQTLGALGKHHPFKFTAVTASWIASGALVPIVNAALMQIAAAFGGGDGDDKKWYKDISKKYWQFTKWDRRNNLIMWVPFTHEFIKIPLAQEFRAFYGLGDMIASKMMGGELAEQSWEDYGWDLLGQVVDMLPLDPTGYDGNILVSICPNAIRPIAELAFNVDFTGKPLFNETEYNKYDPNFTKAYVGTPDWLVRASRMMNSIGNDYPDVQQNKWDAFGDPRFSINNPAVVDHVLSSYLGGAYTMGSQVLGLLTKSLNDQKEIKVADIPLFSKFVINPDDRPVSKKQGDEFWDKKEYYDRASNTISKLKKQAKIDGDYSLLERFYGSEEYKTYKLYEKDVKDYKETRKKERAEESGDEYRPHQLTAEDIYNNHTTSMDEFEDMKLKQLFEKLNSFKNRYDAIVDNAPNESDGYYNANKAAIDAIDEISLDKQEISDLKKGFLDDGKDAYNAEDMKQIRELRKKILAVLEKANKVVVANQKANAKKK